ncbi:MAG: hypothetical protein QOE63_1367 [Acidimicrobiaceae bacterium]|jgi:hypothetical protein
MRVHVAPEQLDLTPGMPGLVQVDVFNDGEIIDGYHVSVHGFMADDVEGRAAAEPAELSLFPDSEGTVFLNLTVPPAFPAGTVSLVIEVTSTIDASRTITAPIEVTVAAIREAELRVEPVQVVGRRRAWLTVSVTNRGNVPLDVGLSGADEEQMVAFAFAKDRLAVGRGRQESTHAWVAGRRPWLGSPAPRLLTVSAHGEGGPLQASATFVQKPLIPRAALTLLAIVAALGLWGALLFRGVDTAAKDVAHAVNEPSGASVNGVVTDGNGPLGGVTVQATGGKGDQSTSTLTEGAIGSFAFSGLPSRATYVLTFSKDGYASQSRQIQTPAGDAPIDVGTIALTASGGSISGTVTAPDGTPVGGATVSVTRGTDIVASTTSASIGSVGFYVVSGLPTPGTYAVTFSVPGFATQTKAVNLAAGGDAPDGGVQLARDTVGTVGGQVSRNANGSKTCGPVTCPLGGVTVTITDGTHSFATVSTTQPADQAGRYSIAGLAPGTYAVTFTREGYQSESTSVTIGATGGYNVDAVLVGTPGVVSGSAPGCTSVEIRTMDLLPIAGLTATPGQNGGAYSIGGVPTPGDYRVVFNGPTPVVVDVSLDGGEARSINAACAPSA